MNALFNLLAGIVNGCVKLAMLALAGLFVVGLLALVLLAVLASIIWSLLHGRKPAVLTTFTHFQQASQQFRQRARPSSHDDVVDLQAHDVHEIHDALEPPTSPKS